MTGTEAPGAPPVATLVTAAAAAGLAWHPLDSYDGVEYKLLWRSGKSVAGLLRIAPGDGVTPHTHTRSHHHLWVIDGEVEILGQRVGPGAFVHVPAHVQHSMRATGDTPCTVLYLYLRDESGADGDS